VPLALPLPWLTSRRPLVAGRAELQERLRSANPVLLSAAAELGAREAEARPDGDADVGVRETDALQLVDCSVCGGVLKPLVVFFGA